MQNRLFQFHINEQITKVRANVHVPLFIFLSPFMSISQTESIEVRAKPVVKIEKAIIKLNEELSESEKKENSIIETYVATYKDKKGNNTGGYFLVHRREGESMDSVKQQAKLIAGDTRYFLQSSPISKGYCGILYQIVSTGTMQLKNKIVGGKEAANKISDRMARTNDQKVLKLICN